MGRLRNQKSNKRSWYLNQNTKTPNTKTPVCTVCTGYQHGPYQTDGPQVHRGESAPKATRHQSGSQECTGSRRGEKSSSISSGFVFALYSPALNVEMHHHPHVTTTVQRQSPSARSASTRSHQTCFCASFRSLAWFARLLKASRTTSASSPLLSWPYKRPPRPM